MGGGGHNFVPAVDVELPVADPAAPEEPPSGLGPGGPGFSLSSVFEAPLIGFFLPVNGAVISGVPNWIFGSNQSLFEHHFSLCTHTVCMSPASKRS